jgi:hypothetical protein
MNPEEKDLNVRWDGLKTLADSTEALRNVKLG